ncbi:hypothetical protein CKO28_06200 [Rhodovibrio sodomensis]|uniref:Uncharacterized protein n=1 Tax=Rhodovibrio sodomensis TaxID=1088 RepID=A0ABS1DCK2_9PROT|nr:hypothetical protein [Rhodovibrio sodomensis]
MAVHVLRQSGGTAGSADLPHRQDKHLSRVAQPGSGVGATDLFEIVHQPLDGSRVCFRRSDHAALQTVHGVLLRAGGTVPSELRLHFFTREARELGGDIQVADTGLRGLLAGFQRLTAC